MRRAWKLVKLEVELLTKHNPHEVEFNVVNALCSMVSNSNIQTHMKVYRNGKELKQYAQRQMPVKICIDGRVFNVAYNPTTKGESK